MGVLTVFSQVPRNERYLLSIGSAASVASCRCGHELGNRLAAPPGAPLPALKTAAMNRYSLQYWI
jgi:hypothetical protein